MISALTWLDYSDRERQKALEVVDLFREHDTVDELGLGSIRDGLANHFFPGTSTIQTHVRYFLFIPWLLRDLEQKRVRSARMPKRVRQAHNRLCCGLVEAGETLGVIGRRAGEAVRRLPSSVYWFGLREWGIRIFPGSEDQYFRSLDSYHRAHGRMTNSDDGELVGELVEPHWDPHVPVSPKNFPDGESFTMTTAEADYLSDRILSRAPGTLLAEFVARRELAGDVDFPWEHPLLSELRLELAEAVNHARRFSLAMYGAVLLYNLMIAELCQREEWVDKYRKRLTGWWEELADSDVRTSWSLSDLWQLLRRTGARVPIPTQRFVENWVQRVTNASRAEQLMKKDSEFRCLVRDRERVLKGGLARVDNAHAREMWSGGSGTARLDFRWKRPVQTMIDEIVTPLREAHGDA